MSGTCLAVAEEVGLRQGPPSAAPVIAALHTSAQLICAFCCRTFLQRMWGTSSPSRPVSWFLPDKFTLLPAIFSDTLSKALCRCLWVMCSSWEMFSTTRSFPVEHPCRDFAGLVLVSSIHSRRGGGDSPVAEGELVLMFHTRVTMKGSPDKRLPPLMSFSVERSGISSH